jgi:hypothetical protein
MLLGFVPLKRERFLLGKIAPVFNDDRPCEIYVIGQRLAFGKNQKRPDSIYYQRVERYKIAWLCISSAVTFSTRTGMELRS